MCSILLVLSGTSFLLFAQPAVLQAKTNLDGVTWNANHTACTITQIVDGQALHAEWLPYAGACTTVTFSPGGGISGSAYGLFSADKLDDPALQSIQGAFSTTGVTNMSYMFSGCSYLTSLDVSAADTSSVTTMDHMFAFCSSLSSLNLSSFNTSNVVSMEAMFAGCSNLATLDLSSFTTQKVTSMLDIDSKPHASFLASCNSLDSLTLGSDFLIPASHTYSSAYCFGLSDKTPLDEAWCTKQDNRTVLAFPSVADYQNAHLGAAHTYFGGAPDPTPKPVPARTGWVWGDEGWMYITENGFYKTSEWSFIDGVWYYFKENSVIESDCWAWIGDAWYGFWANGAMCTGWVWDSSYSDYFYCGTEGRMVKGTWVFIDNEWYGFWADGTMCRGWVWDSSWNSWFFCSDSGVMARNMWLWSYDGWYWARDNGTCQWWCY